MDTKIFERLIKITGLGDAKSITIPTEIIKFWNYHIHDFDHNKRRPWNNAKRKTPYREIHDNLHQKPQLQAWLNKKNNIELSITTKGFDYHSGLFVTATLHSHGGSTTMVIPYEFINAYKVLGMSFDKVLIFKNHHGNVELEPKFHNIKKE